MAAEIVHAAGLRTSAVLFGISAEPFAVDRSVEHTTSGETITAQSAEKCQNPQATVRRKALYSVVLGPSSRAVE
ncbi:hypothetical protein [Bradyrhizobium sp. B117]|uniref:hypothetical protein n=1 Tax=Bradyrhizobium sp. B117 TaxID=3140246 RepID=UPI003183DDAE